MEKLIVPDLGQDRLPEENPRAFLEEKVEKLRFICERLNPYEPIPDYLKRQLRSQGLGELVDGSYDPFALTNKLIFLMENALEELELYKN